MPSPLRDEKASRRVTSPRRRLARSETVDRGFRTRVPGSHVAPRGARTRRSTGGARRLRVGPRRAVVGDRYRGGENTRAIVADPSAPGDVRDRWTDSTSFADVWAARRTRWFARRRISRGWSRRDEGGGTPPPPPPSPPPSSPPSSSSSKRHASASPRRNPSPRIVTSVPPANGPRDANPSWRRSASAAWELSAEVGTGTRSSYRNGTDAALPMRVTHGDAPPSPPSPPSQLWSSNRCPSFDIVR